VTTIENLVDTEPVATAGVPAGFVHGAGEWRHVLEIADPSAGSAIVWHDITGYFTGYDYTRGADSYQGRYRASVATIDLFTDDDLLAPWNTDTTLVFGTNVELGPGLLIRSGFIRVDGGVVVEWNPRFTDKVESWGDASYSKGRVRQHTIVARDTLTSLVAVPLPARPEENWADRIGHFIADSGWPYGQLVHGAITAPGGAPIKLLAARPAQASAITELDATLDPAGLIWFTNRKGQLVIRPPVWDTFHTDALAGGAAGLPWFVPDTVVFHWGACAGEPGAAYAVDTDAINPFGLDKSELAVINHVVITTPASGSIPAHTYNDDDPISIQRHDRKTMQATWIAANDTAAGDLLAFRANAILQARPLTTTVDLDGFHPGPANIDIHDPLTIVHQNRAGGLEVTADGFMRSYRERVLPRGCDTNWSLEITADIAGAAAEGYMIAPVDDLTLVSVTDKTASFSWTNPAQVITPTHTQIRMLDATSAWDTVGYPITAAAWSHLRPETGYQFEVRLIREVDGIITHFSSIRSLAFETLEPAEPHVEEDPDDPGGGLIIKFPPPAPGCTLEWQLEQSDGISAWTVIDSGSLPSGSDLVYPTGALDPTKWYRMCSREVCSGTPGAWTCSEPFTIACLEPARLGTAPYNDADLFAYWPQVCAVDRIEEAVSNTPLTLGNAFASIGFVGSPSVPAMLSHGQGVIGSSTGPTPPSGSTDQTIACRIQTSTLPGPEQWLFQFGGMVISLRNSGAGFKVVGQARHSGGGTTEIVGSTVLALHTDYDLVLSHDVGGDLKLYANGVVEGTSAAVAARIASSTSIQLTAASWITDCAVWDRVLAITEIPGYVPVVAPAPVFVTATSTVIEAASLSTITLPLPAGWVPGQLAIAVMYSWGGSGAVMLDETGWTRVGTAISGRVGTIFHRILQAGDANPTFDYSSAVVNRHGYIVTYSGVGTVNELAPYYSGTTTVVSATPPPRTVADDNTILLCIPFVEFYGGCNMSAANGFTSRKTSGTVNNYGSTQVVEKEVDAGTHTFPTFTWGTGANSSRLSSIQLALVG